MITVSQIGAGQWGKNLIRAFANLPNCKMKMFCDQNPETVRSLSEYYHHQIQGTSDLDSIFNDSQTDAVIIASPPDTHAALALRALEADKHVFVEKPLALHLDDARKILALSEKKKKLVMVGHLLLYHPAVRKLKASIDDGQLGNIHYLYSTRVNLGRVREVENALWSLTAHDISVAIYFLDQEPIEVTAVGSAYLRKNVQDVVFVNMLFKNDVRSHIHASWLDPHKIREFTVVGSKKMAVFDDMENTEKLRFYDKGVEKQKNEGGYETFLTLRHGDIHIPRIDMMEPLKLECQHFIDCISEGKEAMSDAKNGLAVLKVLSAAQESLECHGKPIRI